MADGGLLEKGEKREDLQRRPTGKAERESDFVSFGVLVAAVATVNVGAK